MLQIGAVTYTVYQIVLLPVAAVVILVGLRFYLRYATSGRVILAVAEDREAARAIGINVSRVYLTTFIIGAVLAALGGSLCLADDIHPARYGYGYVGPFLRGGRLRRSWPDRGSSHCCSTYRPRTIGSRLLGS